VSAILLRFPREAVECQYTVFDLIDLLRLLSRYDTTAVIGRVWELAEVAPTCYGYGSALEREEALAYLDCGYEGESARLSGERLMERAAVVAQFESGLFLRLIDPRRSAQLESSYKLRRGPARFQATNTDLEIRRDEIDDYELVTADERLVSHLQVVVPGVLVVPHESG
jgi:hypothetical protein